MTDTKQKVFVLDTNVILHDSSCIYKFEENDIVIPITVLEELDQFKKGNDTVNYHARKFLRSLDSLSGEMLFNGGIQIGEGLGTISVMLERAIDEDLALSFSPDYPDHHILNIAYHLAKDKKGKQVILISKDVNLRMKAKAVGLCAQDYKSDQVKDISALYTGRRIEEPVSSELIDKMYMTPAEIPVEDLSPEVGMTPNEYVILRNPDKSALARYNPHTGMIQRVDKIRASGIMPRNAEQAFAINALLNDDIQLVTMSGKAGTGKTLLALAAALEVHAGYRQVYMARPVVPLSNKDLGYLPGDIESKLDPYMQPLFDNLGVIRDQYSSNSPRYTQIQEMLENETLKIAPLSYIRGRSLVKIFFIVDEAQNLTPHEIKTIITRAGEETKMVFTGDIFQIDHPFLDSQSNGLSYLIEKMHGQNIYAHINLEKGERSKLADIASNLL
jgi:PhoH-like ATPase